MRRRGFTLVRAVLLLFVVGVLIVILYPFDSPSKRMARRSVCRSNLKQIGLAFLQYSRDYDAKFPPVSSGNEGWVDVVQPYLKTYNVFVCPTVGAKSDSPTSDYFYNARLSGLLASEVRGYKPPLIQGQVIMGQTGWSRTIMAGDGVAGAGTNSHIVELPFEWRTDETSPARRHFNGANYLLTDGSMVFHRLEQVGTGAPRKGVNEVTFAIR